LQADVFSLPSRPTTKAIPLDSAGELLEEEIGLFLPLPLLPPPAQDGEADALQFDISACGVGYRYCTPGTNEAKCR